MDLQVGIALFSYVIFLFSTVCHEAAHALAAKLGGDLTAYHAGQVSLDPIPHIRREPFGLGLLPLLSLILNLQSGGLGVFGFASAPFDPYWAMRHPRRAAWMAMAGPAANLFLAMLGIVLLKVCIWGGVLTFQSTSFNIWQLAKGSSEAGNGLAVFLSILFFENLLLCVWNLLPIPPMDGFSILLFVLPEKRLPGFFRIRQEVGMMFPLIMFGISGVFWDFFWPVTIFVVQLAFL